MKTQIRDFFNSTWVKSSTPFFVCVILLWIACLLIPFIATFLDSPDNINRIKKAYTLFGSVGDTFGALTCLYTGLSLAAVITTLLLQKKAIEQQQDELRAAQQQAIRVLLYNLIDRLAERKQSLTMTLHGQTHYQNDVTRQLLDETKKTLIEFVHYAGGSNTPDGLQHDFNSYLEALNHFVNIYSQCYYTLKQISSASLLENKEKEDIAAYMIFTLSPEDKQLLNIIFLRFELQETLADFSYLFNEETCREQLLHSLEDFSEENLINKQKGVCFFMNSMKAHQACECAERKEEENNIVSPLKYH